MHILDVTGNFHACQSPQSFLKTTSEFYSIYLIFAEPMFNFATYFYVLFLRFECPS